MLTPVCNARWNLAVSLVGRGRATVSRTRGLAGHVDVDLNTRGSRFPLTLYNSRCHTYIRTWNSRRDVRFDPVQCAQGGVHARALNEVTNVL